MRCTLHGGGAWWPPSGAPVGACQWLPMELACLRGCRGGWTPDRADLAACEWLPLGCRGVLFAAAIGHLPMLKFLRRNGCPWDDRVYKIAALRGKLAVLQWAHANGCSKTQSNYEPRCDGMIWMAAVRRGHLDVLQWLHANSLTWGSLTCNSARVLVAEKNPYVLS
mmetsp:Transcript_23789/g.55004  ORF Transcript_23789/g.55004 Transcript_23789/m.55004 type:complete len:166 (-) Transcript_23789:265-762(-)